MATKITLEQKIDALTGVVEKGFAAIADDVADIKQTMATKEQVAALHTQVNGIETELRSMKRDKLVTRVADLEDEVFGQARA